MKIKIKNNNNKINKQFFKRYNKYAENINNDGVFSRDFELSSASSVLNKNIIEYRLYEFISISNDDK